MGATAFGLLYHPTQSLEFSKGIFDLFGWMLSSGHYIVLQKAGCQVTTVIGAGKDALLLLVPYVDLACGKLLVTSIRSNRHIEAHMSSRPRAASQPNSAFALSGLA